MEKRAVVTIEAHEPVAVFINGGNNRVELHPGDKATFDELAIHIEPVMIMHRESRDTAQVRDLADEAVSMGYQTC